MWETVKLTEIATVTTGKWDANHASDNGEYRFYTCASKHMYSETKRFSGECLILPGNGANVGDVYYFNGDFDAYQRTYVIHDIKILPKFLMYHMVMNWRFVNESKQFGSATNFIKIGNFKDYDVSFPPLAEQQRIVAKLDAEFAEIDRGIKTTKAKESEISRLNTSILSTTLSEHNHKRVKLGSIATVIAGQSPKSEYYNKEGRGTPFYQGKKDYGKRYLNEPTVWTDKVTKLAEKNDILLSVRAPVGALNIATQQICIGRGLAAIRPSTKVLNDYLFY